MGSASHVKVNIGIVLDIVAQGKYDVTLIETGHSDNMEFLKSKGVTVLQLPYYSNQDFAKGRADHKKQW